MSKVKNQSTNHPKSMEYTNEAFDSEIVNEDGGVSHHPKVQPNIQQMERGEIPDIPNHEEPTEDANKVNSKWTIFKRLVSAFFIIVDSVGDWSNFADMNNSLGNSTGTDDEPFIIAAFQRMTEIKDAIKGSHKTECDKSTHILVSVNAILLAFGTLYGLMQVINILSETLLELVGKREGKSKVGCQILHGWLETFGSLLFEDVPQTVVLLFFAESCRREHIMSVWSLIFVVVPIFKNFLRKFTCKIDRSHIKKQKKSNCCRIRIRCFTCNVPCPILPNLSCFKWIMCGHPPEKEEPENDESDDQIESLDPDVCVWCKCIPQIWQCTTGTFCFYDGVICRHKGFCDPKFNGKACCKFERVSGCCPKKPPTKRIINKNPTYIEPFVYILYVIEVYVTVAFMMYKWLPDPEPRNVFGRLK